MLLGALRTIRGVFDGVVGITQLRTLQPLRQIWASAVTASIGRRLVLRG